ncbi:hypothetical protein FQR65_LT13478 [Abscondita terminalis]|nr:hypothetical protein FQR65_LT13478 [Abscondita terminalis]
MAQAVLVPQIKNVPLSKIQLTNDKFLIGRDLHNNHVIEDVTISRSHCVFIRKDDCWYLLDKYVLLLKSSNGTWLNGNLLDKAKEYKLLHGDVIVLSNNVKFEYQIGSDDSENVKTFGENNTTNPEIIEGNLTAGVYVGKLNGNALSQLNLENVTNLSNMSSNVPQEVDEAKPLSKNGELTYAEDELQCSICTEMFIKAVTLSCSHTFCKYCITQWRKNQTICPICRAVIKMQFSTLVLDNFINKIVENSDDELKNHRLTIIKERESATTSTPGPSGSGRNAENLIEISSSDSSSDQEDEEEDDEDDHDNSHTYGYSFSEDDEEEEEDWSYNYNGIPGHYFGGYGKCYSCGQRGHWANGCPTKRRR